MWRRHTLALFACLVLLFGLTSRPVSSVAQAKAEVPSGLPLRFKVPTASGAPFSLVLLSTWSRATGGDGSPSLISKCPIARDTNGRVHQEHWTMVPAGELAKSQLVSTDIEDPVTKVFYQCVVSTRICSKSKLNTAISSIPDGGILHTGELHASQSERVYNVHEDLGSQDLEGVKAIVFKDTQTHLENEGKPVRQVVSRKAWFSPDLRIYLRIDNKSDQVGQTDLVATELRESEPDPRLFLPPEGYTISDLIGQDGAAK